MAKPNRKPPHDGSLLNTEQVSALLNLHPQSVRSLAKAGKLPKPIAIGRHNRWRRDEIEALLSRDR